MGYICPMVLKRLITKAIIALQATVKDFVITVDLLKPTSLNLKLTL